MAQMDRHTAENLKKRLEDLKGATEFALNDIELWLTVHNRDEAFDVDQINLKKVILSAERFSSAWVRNRIR
jgi:hypothetical protein